jgi:acetyl esterase/lipase
MNWVLRPAHLLSWIGVLGATVWVWTHDPRSKAAMAERAGIVVQQNLVYRDTGARTARLDIYLPAGPIKSPDHVSLRPGVLAIHGGSWTGGSRYEYGAQVARLARYGQVVFVTDYFLARPGQPGWPAALGDLREAIRWIRRHAADYGVDPDRLVALGSGAGGHLAALLGTKAGTSSTDEPSSRVQAVVSLYGPSDLEETVQARRLANDPVWLFLGENPREGVRTDRFASPINQVAGDTSPMLLFHGLDDTWVSPRQSQAMAERLTLAGVKNRLILVPGARHGFEFKIGVPETRDILPEILAFLETVWQLDVSHLR